MDGNYRVWILASLLTVMGKMVALQQCNSASFICTSTTGFQECVDGSSPSSPSQQCHPGTVCDMTCASPCMAPFSIPCAPTPSPTPPPKQCTATGFYCETNTSFTQCVDDDLTPYPDVSYCSSSVCSMFCPLPCWEHPCPDCKENGRLPVEGSSTDYFVCTMLSDTESVFEEYTCPAAAVFNPVTKRCESTSEISTSTPSTTTPTTTTPTTTTPTTTTPTTTTLTTTMPTTTTLTTTTPTTTTPTTTTPTTTTLTITTPTTTTPTTTTSVTTTTTSPGFTCTTAGRFPDPANCKMYYICSVLTAGGLMTSHYTCPGNSNYDPVTTMCSVQTTCTATSTTRTTTPPIFRCPMASGKFPDPVSCNSYYMCTASVAYSYQCPGKSVFYPKTKKCVDSSIYSCSSNEESDEDD